MAVQQSTQTRVAGMGDSSSLYLIANAGRFACKLSSPHPHCAKCRLSNVTSEAVISRLKYNHNQSPGTFIGNHYQSVT